MSLNLLSGHKTGVCEDDISTAAPSPETPRRMPDVEEGVAPWNRQRADRTPSPEQSYNWRPTFKNGVPVDKNGVPITCPFVLLVPVPVQTLPVLVPASVVREQPTPQQTPRPTTPRQRRSSPPRCSWTDQWTKTVWADLTDDEMEGEENDGPWSVSEFQAKLPPYPYPKEKELTHDGPLPSKGAREHSGGACRPCAHVWKPEGCQKGADCQFCHRCGKEEFLSYKRGLKAAKRQSVRRGKQEARMAAEEESTAVSPAAEDLAQQADTAPGLLSKEYSTQEAAAAAPDLAEARGGASTQDSEESTQRRSVPSLGSAGHADGKCRPCAHNWRSTGCAKGADCSFCHVCDEEDFRAFRRLNKVTKEQKAAAQGSP